MELAAEMEIDETGMAALAMAEQLAELHYGTVQVVGCAGETERRLGTIGTARSTRPGSDVPIRATTLSRVSQRRSRPSSRARLTASLREDTRSFR